MHIDFMLEVFQKNQDKTAIIWKDKFFNYKWLLDQVISWQEKIKKEKIESGTIIILEADFSPNALALLLVLIEMDYIIVPLTSSIESQKPEFIEIAEGEVLFKINENDQLIISRLLC